MNRAAAINTIAFIILGTASVFFTEQILLLFGTDRTVVDHAYTYLCYSLFSAYLLCMYDMFKRFLYCFKISWAPMLAQVTATCFHALWCHLFVVQWDMDIKGIGLANAVTSIILTFTLIMISLYQPSIREALRWPDSTIWDEWKAYLYIALPTTSIFWTELAAG